MDYPIVNINTYIEEADVKRSFMEDIETAEQLCNVSDFAGGDDPQEQATSP